MHLVSIVVHCAPIVGTKENKKKENKIAQVSRRDLTITEDDNNKNMIIYSIQL